MALPFLDRRDELTRLKALLRRREGSLAIVYGRRRIGKSRLVTKALPRGRSIYFVGDDRASALQRVALAAETSRLLPGFADVSYPDWESLLTRLWRAAPRGTALALDEFSALVAADPALPSLLQKLIDRKEPSSPHLLLAGSSQRLMHGLTLAHGSPLFGRAREILKIAPLPAGCIKRALKLKDDSDAIEALSVWGGVPRYWELAADCSDLRAAFRALALSPLGVLHDEPRRLLLDDLRDTAQPLSILALIGAGCHRLSEIAGRLGRSATSLARPMETLLDLGLVRRDLPFGSSLRDTKRTAYRIADPFLRFWFRYVEPNRSRLEAGGLDHVAADVASALSAHVAGTWEDLVRESVPRTPYLDTNWGPSASWWGPGLDRRMMEVDVVAESSDRKALLVGEVKWQERVDWRHEARQLQQKAAQLPFVAGRVVRLALWTKRPPRRPGVDVAVFGPTHVLRALR
ncbi:MAG: ATP-binding protein [Vicinamibacteria bacterium]|jgi:hypothetical protein|nr:ATP-binding protein [Vicinamibacteria bacterium]